MINDLKEIIENFDVISFDVFDTLLLRPYLKPADLFLRMENNESLPGFAAARIKAECLAYADMPKMGMKERTLHDIYSYISTYNGLEAKEVEYEERSLVANPEIVGVYNNAKNLGKTVVITSDMYLPYDVIVRLLKKNGIDGWSRLYLSSEEKAQKKTGELYEKIANELDVKGKKLRFLHIGDDWYSDVIAAQKAGVSAVCYPKVADRFLESHPFVNRFLARADGEKGRFFVGAMALGWHLYKCQHTEADYWHELGFVQAGSLGNMYMSWVLHQCREMGVNHLMFLGRDGYIWQKMVNIMDPSMNTDYFYSSRNSALLATARECDENWSSRDRRERIVEVLRLKAGLDIRKSDVNNYLERGVLTKDMEASLAKLSEVAVDVYSKYLQQFSVSKDSTALVDGCSLNGSGQRLVEIALKHNVRTFYLLLMGDVKNGSAVFNSPPQNTRFIDLCEFMFGAPTPPVAEIVDGKPVFSDNVEGREQFKINICSSICDGAVNAVEVFKRFGVEMTPEEWLDWCDAFMDNLTARDRLWLSQACNAGDVGHLTFKSVIWRNPALAYVRRVLYMPLFNVVKYRVGREWRLDYLLLGKIRVRRRVMRI